MIFNVTHYDGVAIHNKNGKGLLLKPKDIEQGKELTQVAIHNKNGKGLLPRLSKTTKAYKKLSQSTIKMEKGYYSIHNRCRFM